MTRHHPISRRTALAALTGTLTAIAGCLDTIPPGSSSGSSAPNEGNGTLSTKMADGGRLIVTLADGAEVDRVNLIQPNGELYDTRDVAAGVSQVTFELGTTYQPGDYTILALDGETTTAETTQPIQPDLTITDVGLYRNHPDKQWDEVYGESETDRVKAGEAFVTVKNSGTGPDAVTQLVFTGDVPNPIENPTGNGIYGKDRVVVPAGDAIDVFSKSFPFGTVTEGGMGCSREGNSGEFTVEIVSAVKAGTISKSFQVEYSGSSEISDCTIEITES